MYIREGGRRVMAKTYNVVYKIPRYLLIYYEISFGSAMRYSGFNSKLYNASISYAVSYIIYKIWPAG